MAAKLRTHIRLNFSAILIILLQILSLINGSLIGFHTSFTSSASPYTVIECNTICTSPGTVMFSLQIVRSGDLSNTDTVYVSTRAPTDSTLLAATADVDYIALNNVQVDFSPSQTLKTLTITVISDGVYEEDEYFEAVLSTSSAGISVTASTSVAYIRIRDGGDAGIFAFSAATYTFREDSGAVKVRVVRTGGASGTITVTYRLSNQAQATAFNNKNFQITDSVFQLIFLEGQREAFININIINDAIYEPNEFFYLELSDLAPMKASDATTPIAKYGTTRSAAVFIADDGDAGVFNFVSPYIFCREDNGSVVVSINRTVGTSTSSYIPVNLVVATVGVDGGSNATEGGSIAFDYLSKTETLNWLNGEARKTFSVKIFNNKNYEPVTRAFKIRMTSVAGGAAIGAQSDMWVYVIDDRDAGTLSFKLSSYDVLESAGTVTVEVVRSGIVDASGINTYASGVVTVDVATYAGTIIPGLTRYERGYDYDVVKTRRCTMVSPCTAAAGTNYIAISLTALTFADGETSKTVSISIVNNDFFQAPNQVFKVYLQNPTGGAHLGIDYDHPPEWYVYPTEFLALEKRTNELLDNVGTIVTIKDDADAAVLVSKASLSVSEIGQTDAFDVWLNAAPTGTVTIDLTADTTVMTLSLTSLMFTTTNWATKQNIVVTAVPNNQTQGIGRADIQFTVTSTDATYNTPLRATLADTGFVFASATYTQIPGVYDTGNPLHAFPWIDTFGVMTAPRTTASIAVFILDDDRAGVNLVPERVRHVSGASIPQNYVAVRQDGHSAKVKLALSSEPIGDVTVTFDSDDGISITPTTLTFTGGDWNTQQTITIASVVPTTRSVTMDVEFLSIRVLTASLVDTFYNRLVTEPMAKINVMRYPVGRVLLDASTLETRENDPPRGLAKYTIRLGSEPMHWELPQGPLLYQPLTLAVKAEADTTLTFSEDRVTALQAIPGGSRTTLTAAGNSSNSTASERVANIAALRFPVNPQIKGATGSHQVGSAILRLYRLSGGENGGLGGIVVGAVVASSALLDDWDENTLRAQCTRDVTTTLISCGVIAGVSNTPLASIFPGTTLFSTISSASCGESLVIPTGAFNTVSNTYTASSGWIEIDVTVAINQFLADQFSRDQANQRADVTLLIYTRSTASFVYDGVDEVVFAAKDHATMSFHPELLVVGSGRVNLALGSSVSQSQQGNAAAAVDGKTTSRLGVSSTFAMSTTIAISPWWQLDLGSIRFVEEVVITLKTKVLSATPLPVSFWCLLSNVTMGGNVNKGASGLANAKSKALFKRQFNITTRSTTASDDDTIVLRWRVYGESGTFSNTDDRFVADYTSPVEVRYVLIQIDGENAIALNEIEVYQQALTSARIGIGGFMPSPSVSRTGLNQITFSMENQPAAAGPGDCDSTTAICRNELLFTSGNWRDPQSIGVSVIDDNVATGPRDILLTHSAESLDPDFRGSSVCDVAQVKATVPCNNALFNDSSVKKLRVLDDDENVILLSASQLTAYEGSGVYPHAPVVRRAARVFPASARCSSSNTTVTGVNMSSASANSCSSAFVPASSSWEVCITNSTSPPLGKGSAWMMAGFSSTDQNITQITITLPRMTGVKYLRTVSIYWHAEFDINTTTASNLYQLDNGWVKVGTYTIDMRSNGKQVIDVSNIALSPAKIVLFTFDKSYDDIHQCIIAPQVAFVGYDAVPFPLKIRGDLSNIQSIPPAESKRSRMHEFGVADTLQIKLTSEPIKDVIVSVQIESKNSPVSVFDATNSSNAPPSSLVILSGGVYESGETVTFKLPTALRFTPSNWNIPQEFTFLAVDDNDYNANRTFSISHVATSDDATVSVIPVQQFSNGKVTRTFGTLSASESYTNAPYVTSSDRDTLWPHHWAAAFSSTTGTVQIHVIDDDLPGVTLSQSVATASESGPDGGYSVALDSAPAHNVIIKISYEMDASLLTVAPLELTFTRTNWMEPQFVVIHPVSNTFYDASAPITIGYDRLIAKAKQPLLLHTVSSTDPTYNGINVGTNEHDAINSPYKVNQGVRAVVLDDDTGCMGEYTCQNGGQCVPVQYITPTTGIENSSPAYVCQCPTTFGMKNCSAVCKSASDCGFSRLEFRLQCKSGDMTAICTNTFNPSRLVTTLYRMLTANEFTSSNGIKYPKLVLGALSEVMYIVNVTQSTCVDAARQGICLKITMDFIQTNGKDSNPIVDKLNAYIAAGSLQSQPLFVELMTFKQQYPQSVGARVGIWIFLGICIACVGGVGYLFTRRYMKMKKFHVRPELHDDQFDECAVPDTPISHAFVNEATSLVNRIPPTTTVST